MIRHSRTYWSFSIPLVLQVVMLCCLFFIFSCEKEKTLEDIMEDLNYENSNYDGDKDEENDSGNKNDDCSDSIGFVFEESDEEPNPSCSSSEFWFKIYRSGNDASFKWQASISDHDIFVTFSGAGVYMMEISAKSNYHAIDRILLFEENSSQNNTFEIADTLSQKPSAIEIMLALSGMFSPFPCSLLGAFCSEVELP